ncbi:MAG: hypothetical protein HGA71_07805 [Azonexaceae bacterium]|nr:hypothetical protein [Azonexaceae bacterium]
MSTFKDALCLLAIFVLYGITGCLDYDDAVILEQIHQERTRAACLTDLPAGPNAPSRIDDQHLDSPGMDRDAGLSADDLPCLPSVL